MRVLAAVLDLLFPPSERMRRVREIREDEVLGSIRLRTAHNITSMLPYDSRIRDAVTRAKFANDAHAQQLLASALASVLPSYIAEETAFSKKEAVLVPVPLSRKRLRERGYNQVAEIIRRAGISYARVDATILTRTRDTKAQTTLGRDARRANMVQAFSAKPCDPAYLYICIDDVATTGATLHACARALRAAGATDIRLLALAAPLERRG